MQQLAVGPPPTPRLAHAPAPAASTSAAAPATAPASSSASNLPAPPTTPSTSNFSLSSLFSSTSSRTPRRPGTSSALPGQSFRDTVQPRGPTSPSNHRRALTVGTSGASGGLLRKNSLSRKASLGDIAHYSQQQQQPQQQQGPPPSLFRGLRRRANSISALRERDGVGTALGVTRPISPPPEPPPALPGYALPSSSRPTRDADILSPTSSRSNPNSFESTVPLVQTTNSARMLNRSATGPVNGMPTPGSGMMPPPTTVGMQGEASMVHQHIQEMANKRISTLEYLRKAHEGRVYWFNTLLFDKPDLARMPYFDTRRLARRATNYLLLGLSLPTVIDLNSNTPMEFLRSFNLLLAEFDSFQSLHPESGASSALGRARMPNLNVFRRATPSAKARRSSSATNETLYESEGGGMLTANGSAGSLSGPSGGGGGGAGSGSGTGGSSILGNGGLGGSASVVSFGQSEADLLPGEEYVHLLTPSLPFDPDFFETFATLCDVLIDAYTRLLSLLSSPRDCNAAVAELFTKADAKVRKIIVQGIVKEFEDTSRNGVRTEVANVGKIVLSGLM